MGPDMNTVARIIAEVAAQHILPRFRHLGSHDIELKGPDDPVTVADRDAERALSARLAALLPGSGVVGEELCSRDSGVLGQLLRQDDVWVIDPLDGTRNFIAGTSAFATMVALVRNGETIGAWIHAPVSQDTLVCEHGGGLWLNGERLNLAAAAEPVAPLCLMGPKLRTKLLGLEPASLAGSLPRLENTCAASFDYARLFSGSTHFGASLAPRATCLLFRKAKPWDHLPGLLMVRELQGYAASWNGAPYSPQRSPDPLLVAPDRDQWHELRELLGPFI